MKYLILLFFFFSSSSFAQTADEVRRIMNPQSTYYQILGVSENATDKEINTACKKLFKTYHPDHFDRDPVKKAAANKVLIRINESRDTLSDPLLRRQYDAKIKISARAKATQKWQPQDFKNTAKPATTAKAQTAAQASTSTTNNAKKATAAEPPNAAPQAKPTDRAQSSTASANKSAPEMAKPQASQNTTNPRSAEATSAPPRGAAAPNQNISPEARAAMKFYEDTARCGGEAFFKHFVDVMM